MSKKKFDNLDCSVAQALSQIGEHWTLMILRNAMHGIRRFEDFQTELNISPTVLSSRLKSMVKNDILYQKKSKKDGRSIEYRLTQKGLDVYPIIVSLLDFGEKYMPSGKGPRIQLVEKRSGKPVRKVRVQSEDGRDLTPFDVKVVAGDGADNRMKQLIDFRERRKE